MIDTNANKMTRSRWLDWQPTPRTTVDQPPHEATKPSKPSVSLSSVGFVGADAAEIFVKDDVSSPVFVAAEDSSGTIPAMPPGVRLLEWNPKEPPVAIESCSLVVNTTLFAKSTLNQLRIALAQPKRSVGWSVAQLVDRLAQVGVRVVLESDLNI